MDKVRVKSSDPSATLSLSLYDDKDKDGCYTIKFSDVGIAESHGFYLWRPHHQAVADATRAASQPQDGPGRPDDDSMAIDSPDDADPAPDGAEDQGGGTRVRLRKR